MPKIYKINSIIIFTFAVLFYFFFMFTKHNPSLSAIIPFANDPYDSIGSFGVIISGLLGILALIRTFRPYRKNPPTTDQIVFLVRTQMAIVSAVLVTIGADFIAMARHQSLWMGQIGGNELLLLISGMAVLDVLIGYLVRLSIRRNLLAFPREYKRAIITFLIFIILLALYPESVIQSTFGELFALVSGIILLFAPMSSLTTVLVQYEAKEIENGKSSNWFSKRWVQWSGVALFGIVVGTFSLIGESIGEGGGEIPLSHIAIVASVFIGAGTAGLVVAYAFLRKPLGLFQ